MSAGSAHNARSPLLSQAPVSEISRLASTAPEHDRTGKRAHPLRTVALCAAIMSFAVHASPCFADDAQRDISHATGPNEVAPAASSTAENGPIRVVVALPLTGARRTVGAAARQRLTLVQSAFDAAGGVARRALQLDIQDDACSRETARELATRVAAMSPPPAVVIGHPCATAAIAAAPVYQQAGVLFLAAGMRHPQLTEKRAGPLVFRAAGRDDRQGADAGRRLRTLCDDKGTSLIVHDRTILARSLAKAAREAASYGAQPEPTELAIVAGENDYTKTIDEIANRRPGAILFLGFPSEAAIILRQLRARGLDVPFVVNDAMATAEFIDHAGDLLDTHVEVMMPVSINRDTLAESEMADALVASDVAAALSVWADAVTATASADATTIAQRLSSARSHLEEIGFDSTGDALAPSYAPFQRRDNVWQRADLSEANVSATSPTITRPTASAPHR